MMPLFALFGLILLSAFFSGSETGLTSVSRAKIHKLKMEGNKRAIVLSNLRKNKERLIGAILLGNNVVNIAASAIATSVAIRYMGESGVFYTTAVMTVLVLVFAEVMPKTYAIRNADSVALTVAPVFVVITKVLSPITETVQRVVDRTINLFSSDEKNSMSGLEMLRGTLDMYHEEGEVEKEHKNMVTGLLDLDNTKIETVMIHRRNMVSVSIDQPVEKIIDFIADCSHSRIPLWNKSQETIIGIVYTREIFRATRKHQGDLSTLDLKPLIHEPWFVPESTMLINQLNAFRARNRHFAVVVDEFGSVSGIVTLEDILEEIVGEIEDEHDKPNSGRIRASKNGAFNVDGDLTIRDLNKALDWDLPMDEATSVAGLILAEAQCIPEVGDIFESGEFMFKVLKKSGIQITRVQIRKINEPPPVEQREISEDTDESIS
jgi:Mg2+/Co2+ transporter CorB